MQELFNSIVNALSSFEGIATIIATVLTLVATLFSLFAQRAASNPLPSNTIASETQQNGAQERLSEAKSVLARHQSIVTWNRIATNSLTFGQYIIGGILATSFVQSALSPTIISILGVLVLLSSLIHQYFRPDNQYRSALHRSIRLKALIRNAEDELFAIQSKHTNALDHFQVRKQLSKGLAEIEEMEIQDLNDRSKKDSTQQEQSTT